MRCAEGRSETSNLAVATLLLLFSGLGCSSPTASEDFSVEIKVNVTKIGAGSGTVISSDVVRSDGSVYNLSCGPGSIDCGVTFDDIGGSGVLLLTATPEPGSVHSGWNGSTCNLASGLPPACTVSADNGTINLEFDTNQNVVFDVNVFFDPAAPPPLPTEAILFQSQRDGNSEIYSISPNGTGVSRITTDPADDIEPAWSGDRTRIAFVSDRDGNDEIYTMVAGGGSPVRLTTLAGSDRRPAFGDFDELIFFDSTEDGDEEIFVTNADGTGAPTQLTSNATPFDQGPSWHINGVLFTSFRDGVDNIYEMRKDGSIQHLRINTGLHDYQPDWSPDGRNIAFTQQDFAGNDNIFVVMNVYAVGGPTITRQLTFNNVEGQNLMSSRDPTWSPDGAWIAFSSNRGGNRDIYIMTPDGLNVTRVTTDAASDSRPAWSD